MPVIGAHVEARHGLWNAFPNAAALGADAIQVHPTPPGFWGSPKPSDEDVDRFRQAHADAGRPPFYFHAVYLINLASDDPKVDPRSESTLAGYLAAADRLGIDGVIFHVGSHRGTGFEAALPGITGRIQRALERADPKLSRLLIENNAGTGGCVGARFEEIRAMIDAVGDPRLRSCFDTCHAFASGYDLRTPAGAAAVIDDWERVVGLDRLEAIHANDSMTGLGSNRDRHQNIGRGEIGEEGFGALLHDPRLATVPFILEVPGFEGQGPDAENIAIMRRLAA
ncbi:MAG TPA: deoxyribonuclease IV [Candidatus Dormibacteraeota bacterium]|nr:deoxyribonuclease IV [Candidatus Dormibacteraeota bacterium]